MQGIGRVRRALGVAAALAGAVIGVQVLGTGQAQAHANAVTGAATCSADGTYLITWTVTNDYQSVETVTATSVDPSSSTVAPESVQIDAAGTGRLTQRAVPGSARTASLAVTGTWSSDGFTRPDAGSVTLPGTCLPAHVPAAPSAVPAACDNVAAAAGAITIPDDPGVRYLLDGVQRDAGTYPATAGTHEVVAQSTVYDLGGQTSFTVIVSGPSTSCAVTVAPATPVVVQATCVDGSPVPSAPRLTVADTDGITYSVSSPGPYTPGQTVLVTATAVAGHAFGVDPPAGWTRVDNAHETYSITFDRRSCGHTVAPQDPTVTVVACTVAGAPAAQLLTTATTAGVRYSVSGAGPYTGGDRIVVTARSTGADEFSTSPPPGWTFADAHTDTYAVTFGPSPTCVSPLTPTVTGSECTASGTSPPTLTFGDSAGIRYTASAQSPYAAGQQVQVSAVALDGYRFVAPAPPGWTFVDPGHEMDDVTFPTAPGCAQVVAPVFIDSTCAGTGPVGATYTVPSVTGVDYRVAGAPVGAGTYHVRDNSTVTVTAVPEPGYTLTGDTVFTHSFPATPDCRTAVVAAAPTFVDGTCSAGSLRPATLTVPNGTGIDYYVDGVRTAAGTYPAADGSTVVVTAIARNGYVLSGLTMFSHTYPRPVGCGIVVTPSSPTFADQSCAGGQVALGASYTVPSVTGVVYEVGGVRVSAGTYPATSGTSITVTARPADGYVLTGTTVFSHRFPVDSGCTGAVQVAAPTFDPSQCTGSGPVPASYTIPSIAGVDYLVRFVPTGSSADSVPAVLTAAGTYRIDRAGSVTVLARVQTGFLLQGRSLYTFQVASACGVQLVPASATFRDPVCLGTVGSTEAAYVVPLSVGAVYYVDGKQVSAGTHAVADGSSVTVQARPAPGYILTGITAWPHRFLSRPSCSATGGLPSQSVFGLSSGGFSGGSGPLAATGVPTALLATGGLVLLLAGAGLLVLGRPRRFPLT